MPDKRTHKSILQYIGLGLFAVSLLIFTGMLGLDKYRFDAEMLTAPFDSEVHQAALLEAAGDNDLFEQTFSSTFAGTNALQRTFSDAQAIVNANIYSTGVPEGKERWEVELPDWQFKSQRANWLKSAAFGPVERNPWLFFLLTIGLGTLGGILYMIPKFRGHAGIKHDHIYHSSVTRGLHPGWRNVILGLTIIGIIGYGFWYMSKAWFWPAVTAVIALIIISLVFFVQRSAGRNIRDAGPAGLSAWIGILAGVYFMGFYIVLYWANQHVVAWVEMVDPLSQLIKGSDASQWFLYGLMYTLIILVMGVRMFAKYRHNKYQLLRTGSVMFFQLSFAFLIPEILVALNKPYYDFKNIWPLHYDFFFDYSINNFVSSGNLGLFMLFWGLALIIVGVPLMVYFLGKRWYCSWVCGCGGLAETMGDPWRQLSDKSQRAWQFERWIVHSVLVFAVLMTVAVLYGFLPTQDFLITRQRMLILVAIALTAALLFVWNRYRRGRMTISRTGILVGTGFGVLLIGGTLWHLFFGGESFLGLGGDQTRQWYGFLIGAGFAGVVGTGFYPLMGNRVWCRFGCPLAAYLGLMQRFQSQFRITTNGGQCISCGNCSTYCEMGIDVRHYAQKGQDIVRASCVGCGVCSAVCPRGVLRLENSSVDSGYRTVPERVIHVSEERGVGIFES